MWLGPADVFGDDGRFRQPASTQDWEEWQTTTQIASVSAPAKRGDRVVQVADAAAAGSSS